ncbi:MAG: ArnT family glycosyltransferase [Anaerolineales bacterium]
MSDRERWLYRGLLLAVLLLGAALRFVGLASVPPGLSPDEAANGYDAYSLALTGRDQHGHLLPLVAASINDYRMPGFIYAAVPFVAAMGLSVTSVRLAAAVMGWLALPVVYRLGRRMFGPEAGLMATALLALSPWHIPFSRMALEGTTVALVAAASVAALWQWRGDRRWRWIWLAGALLGLSFYTYSIMKLFTPLLMGGLALILWRDARARPRQALALAAFVGLLALPMAWDTLNAPEFMQARYNQIAVFKPGRPLGEALGEALANVGAHLGPEFLFVRGDFDALHHPPGAGQLYWVQLPLVLAGVVGGLWDRRTRPATLALLAWIAAALAPVALTQITLEGSGHSHRAIPMVVAWQLLSGVGVAVLVRWLRPRWRAALVILITLATLAQAAPYLHHYFTAYPGAVLARFDDGMPQAVRAMDALDDAYETVVFTDMASWPYLHILFFTRYDPRLLQTDLPAREPALFAPVTRVGKYHIGDVQAAYERLDHGLFVMPAWMLPGVEPLAVTTYSTGEPAFKIVGK